MGGRFRSLRRAKLEARLVSISDYTSERSVRTEVHLLSTRCCNDYPQCQCRPTFFPLHFCPSSPKKGTVDLIWRRERAIHRERRAVDLPRIGNFAARPLDAGVAVPECEVLALVAEDLLGELDGAALRDLSATASRAMDRADIPLRTLGTLEREGVEN